MIKALDRNYRDKLRRLLSVMLPIICTQIAIMGMNFFDASMSGQAGDVDLAGAAIGGNIWMPIQTGISGILMAAMPLVANLLGAGEKEKITVIHNLETAEKEPAGHAGTLYYLYPVPGSGVCQVSDAVSL